MPENVEVCLDERCIPLYTVEHFGGGLGQDGYTSFKIDDSADSFSLVLRTLDGEVLAGPADVEAKTVYPNGKGCAPELLVARVIVQGDGTVEAE